MIQHLLMLLAATPMVVACVGMEDSAESLFSPPQQELQPVSFNAYVNRNTTRAGAIGPLTTDSLKTLPSISYDAHHNTAGFGVYAYHTNNQLYHQMALPDFMFNQQITYDGTKWIYSPVKYWPNEYDPDPTSSQTDFLTFFAYAPRVDTDIVTGRALETNPITGAVTEATSGIIGLTRAKDSGDPFIKYRASYDLTKQVDLCRAEPHLNEVKPNTTDHINFNFTHALAALNVQIDADIDVGSHLTNSLHPNTRIWVRSITLEGFADKGQLNMNLGKWNNLDCDCDLTSRPITIYDGRQDNKEGMAASLNEPTTGLNPIIVQDTKYTTNSTTITAPATTRGVTNTPVNLFDASTWPYANPAAPTDAEIEAVLNTPIYVIPTGAPIQVTIVYDVETYDPKLISQFLSDGQTCGSTIENNISAYITNGSGTPITMTAGKAYTLRLHLGMTSVKVDADVTDWVFGYNAEVEVPK